MVELCDVGHDEELVRGGVVDDVVNIQQLGNPELSLCQSEGKSAVPAQKIFISDVCFSSPWQAVVTASGSPFCAPAQGLVRLSSSGMTHPTHKRLA